MRIRTVPIALAVLPLALACGGSDEADEAPADSLATGEQVLYVADSIIERDVAARLDTDPRLDGEGIELTVHAVDGQVTLLGTVPSRFEMSIAREIAISAPGVRRVFLDSLRVASEPVEEEPATST